MKRMDTMVKYVHDISAGRRLGSVRKGMTMRDVGAWVLGAASSLCQRTVPMILMTAIAFFVTNDRTKGAPLETIVSQTTPIPKTGTQAPISATATGTSQPAKRPSSLSVSANSTVAPAPGSPTPSVSPVVTPTRSPPQITQPPGISPATQSAAQTAVSAQASTNPTDQQKYDAYIASAKAFANAHERSKAIEWYEKAVLVAPDDRARKQVANELTQVSSWEDSDWISPPLKQVQGVWLWALLVVLFLCLLGVFRRVYRWIQQRRVRKHYDVVISPAASEFSGYFRELIRLAHHEFEEQIELARRIETSSANTVVPTFRSIKLIASYSFDLPTEVAKQWWLSYATRIVNLIDPPEYTVDLGVMRLDKVYGLSVRLCSRHKVIEHWHEYCADANVPMTSAELAYRIVARIIDHSSRS
jgi:hypothetical protein